MEAVDLEDRVARVGQVRDVAGAAGVLAAALAAERDRLPRLLVADRDGGGPGGALVVEVLPVDVGPPAEPLVLLGQ